MEPEVALTGRRTAPAPVRKLWAGPVTCELDGIELRDIRCGQAELANLIYVAVRDESWNTIPPLVESLVVLQDGPSFRVTFRARHEAAGLGLSWDGVITGGADGSIGYVLQGRATRESRYNRIGFNILHSVTAVAGQPYRTRDQAGRAVHGSLPLDIAPQAARDGRLTGMLEPFRTLEIDLADGLGVRIECTGDDFETEDQRNFADSTFKTYSTPLQRPAPFSLASGSTLDQSVSLTPIGVLDAVPSTPEGGPIRIDVGPASGQRLPAIGLGQASDGGRLGDLERARLTLVRPAHLRVTVAVDSDPEASSRLATAASDAEALGVPLEVELRLGPDGRGLDAAATLLAPIARQTGWVLVRAPSVGPIDSGPPAEVVAAVRERLATIMPDASVGAMFGNLSSVLRQPIDDPASLGSAGVAFVPTIHRDDDRTVMENTLGLDQQVRAVTGAIGGRPVRVGPVTLASIDGPWPSGASPASGLPPQVDTRQPSLFTAAWTVAALATLLSSGAQSLTLFETCGWRGITERSGGSARPNVFLSRPGGAYPVWQVLAALAAHRDGRVGAASVSDPGRIAALAVDSDAGTLVIVANLTRDPVAIDLRLAAIPRSACDVWVLDQSTWEAATSDPDGFRASARQASADSLASSTLGAYAVMSISVPTS